MKGVTILGSTGTIGVNTLDVISRNRDRFTITALTANTDVERLADQCTTWQPPLAAMADPAAARELRRRLRETGVGTDVLDGVEGLETVAAHPDTDYVMAGIVGAAGLLPTLAAARAGKRVLLANKEAMVMSGQLFVDAVRVHGAELLPIDSEHNAIFQCMSGARADFGRAFANGSGVRRILLTASGGPFRTRAEDDLVNVTPDEAVAHPNWVMGRKISVDSATMMNKGLEVIEACWLFGATPDRVEVVVHPQSIIHSMVEYADGSMLAQLGNPDMRTPIAHALAWPERIESGVEALDLVSIAHLEFEASDPRRFPCLRLGFEAARISGTAPAILNAANEVAVEAFLGRRIRFPDIPAIIEETLSRCPHRGAESLEAVLEDDARARESAVAQVRALA